jgi:hypothetical protein
MTMIEAFSLTWFTAVVGLLAVMVCGVGYFWYKGPRWWAEQEDFTEPQITENETRKRAVLGQILGMPALTVGVATAFVALFSGIQTYRESLRMEYDRTSRNRSNRAPPSINFSTTG